MQPRPIAETTGPPRPSFRCFIFYCLQMRYANVNPRFTKTNRARVTARVVLRFDCHLDRGCEIVRQWSFKAFPFAVDCMSQCNFPRVQHLSRQIFCCAPRIDFIAKDRVTEMMNMHTYLMCASAMQPAFDQARLIS